MSKSNFSSTKIIEINDINFGYKNDHQILKNVSFSVNEGEYICIVGPNGSGKSTISKILAGLLKPWSGSIKIFGKIISAKNIDFLHENIGIIFQNPENQFVGLTVEDDIAFGLENKQIDHKKMKKIIGNVVNIIGIKKLLKLSSQNLSGGQKQKVAIASVLAMESKIIIFDESTSMLDPKSKNELKKLMLILKNKYNKTIISITHDMEETINCDRVLLMANGQIQLFNSPIKLFTQKNLLEKFSLDVPFVMKLSIEMNKFNQKIKPTLNISQLVNDLLQKND